MLDRYHPSLSPETELRTRINNLCRLLEASLKYYIQNITQRCNKTTTNKTRLTFVRFLMAHTTLEHTRAYMEATQDTHTGKPEIAVNLVSAFSHPGLSFLKDPPGAVGSL